MHNQDMETKLTNITAEELAIEFHNTYEQFAETNKWKTQKKCRTNFADLPQKNRETMVDTCQHILLWLECHLKGAYKTNGKEI